MYKAGQTKQSFSGVTEVLSHLVQLSQVFARYSKFVLAGAQQLDFRWRSSYVDLWHNAKPNANGLSWPVWQDLYQANRRINDTARPASWDSPFPVPCRTKQSILVLLQDSGREHVVLTLSS